MVSTEHRLPQDALAVGAETVAPGVAVVRPRGDVDTATVARLRGELAEQLAAGADHLVLDLSGVEFLGSSGLALLVEQREAAGAREGSLWLVAVPRAVSRPLQITGLIGLFDTADDVEAAVAGLTGRS